MEISQPSWNILKFSSLRFENFKATNNKIPSMTRNCYSEKHWNDEASDIETMDGMGWNAGKKGGGIGSKPVKSQSLRREGARSRGKSCRKNRNYPTRVPVHERRRVISARGRDPLIMGVTDAKNADRPWTSSRHVPWQRSRWSGMVRVASRDR